MGRLDGEAFVFSTPGDPTKPLFPTSPTTWLRRFEKKNGLRAISPHDLRHSNGTFAKMAGFDAKDIQTQLGHADTKTTNRFYIGVDTDSLREYPDAIESLIEKERSQET